MNYFFIDSECDGLLGKFLSAAVLVTDDNGNEIEHFYGAVNVAADTLHNDWVKANVVQHLKNAEQIFDGEYDLLEAVWALWIKYRENSLAVADVQHPVESRLFAECIRHRLAEREYMSPFPLLDLSSVLLAKGYEWNCDRKKLSGLNLDPHDAMNDVKTTSEIWFKLMKKN